MKHRLVSIYCDIESLGGVEHSISKAPVKRECSTAHRVFIAQYIDICAILYFLNKVLLEHEL